MPGRSHTRSSLRANVEQPPHAPLEALHQASELVDPSPLHTSRSSSSTLSTLHHPHRQTSIGQINVDDRAIAPDAPVNCLAMALMSLMLARLVWVARMEESK